MEKCNPLVVIEAHFCRLPISTTISVADVINKSRSEKRALGEEACTGLDTDEVLQ